jgi:serine/threonine protein kinase
MERTTFLKNYRVRLKYDGSPYEPERDGAAISYEAVDERTAEPVSVTLIPAKSIDPSEREEFEEHVSTAQKLRHANVAKVLDFGREGDDYVYVSERLPGETLASWVRTHGPMAADAALRVGEQVVSVLSSAGFHKLPYPSIQPSDIMLVPGQTAEGSWPLVKVTNFGLPALMANPEPQLTESEMPQQPASAKQLPSNQQFSQPTRDIRSEIYSLGVTLYFLLTGAAISAEALQQGPKFSGFPKPLRALLGRMMHRDPDQRPKDLLVVTEMIRQSLEKIERRRALSDRYGLPLRTTVLRRTDARPRRLVRTAVAVGALLVLAAAIAPLVFPESIGKLIRSSHTSKPVGVLIGVPESSPPALAQAPQSASATAPTAVVSQPVNSAVAPEPPAPANTATTANPPQVAPMDGQQAQISNAQPQVAASTNSVENSAGATPDNSASADTTAKSAAQANAEPPPTTANQSSSQGKEKSIASKSARAHASPSSAANSSHGRSASVRSRVVGITSDGRLIFRLPSGRTAIVAPDEDGSAPRHRSRVFIDRDQMLGPPPGFGPDYFPND